jgi:hypothetical protein
MKVSIAMFLVVALVGCASNQGGSGILPDCDQASAEQQAPGKCINRPVPPSEKTGGSPEAAPT